MAVIILHHKGAYNLYTTVADGAMYESALTRKQLEQWITEQYGKQGLAQLPERLKRAHKTGTSSMVSNSLANELSCNRAGPNEEHLSLKEFIDQFLTLKPTKLAVVLENSMEIGVITENEKVKVKKSCNPVKEINHNS